MSLLKYRPGLKHSELLFRDVTTKDLTKDFILLVSKFRLFDLQWSVCRSASHNTRLWLSKVKTYVNFKEGSCISDYWLLSLCKHLVRFGDIAVHGGSYSAKEWEGPLGQLFFRPWTAPHYFRVTTPGVLQ